jgi:hypothetical protein
MNFSKSDDISDTKTLLRRVNVIEGHLKNKQATPEAVSNTFLSHNQFTIPLYRILIKTAALLYGILTDCLPCLRTMHNVLTLPSHVRSTRT